MLRKSKSFDFSGISTSDYGTQADVRTYSSCMYFALQHPPGPRNCETFPRCQRKLHTVDCGNGKATLRTHRTLPELCGSITGWCCKYHSRSWSVLKQVTDGRGILFLQVRIFPKTAFKGSELN